VNNGDLAGDFNAGAAENSAVSRRAAAQSYLNGIPKPRPPMGRSMREAHCHTRARELAGYRFGLDEQTTCELLEKWAADFPPGEVKYFVHQAYLPIDFEEDDEEEAEPSASQATATVIQLRPQQQAQPQPLDRVALWKTQRRTPAEGATGTKPDYLDQRRPEGQRILPRSPSGCIAEWIGHWGHHKTGAAIAEACEAVALSRRVLIIALEDGDGVETLRLPPAAAHRGMTLEDLAGKLEVWREPFDITREQDRNDLIATFDDFDPDLIFIDVATLAIGDRSPSADVTGIAMTLGLNHLASAFKATVVALKHPPDSLTGTDMRALGSTLQGGLIYSTVLWMYDEKSATLRGHVAKAKNGPAGFDVFMRNQPAADGTPVIVDVPPEEWGKLTRKPVVTETADQPVDDLREKVVAALKAIYAAGNHKPISVPELVKQIAGCSEQTQAGKTLGNKIRRATKRSRRRKGSLADLTWPGGEYLFKPYDAKE